ncbi:phosphomevalonate kinase [Aerococcus sp. CDC-944-U94]|uniref:phosphomevalonate kinase n=1 Tax=Aerococcus urinae (strain CCUG 59500 / ACS-120-V-Col10a) TaxID=2976812 RepID=UPI00227A47AC|nr:phosphomevalonate kinase [Aerococcus sp. Group 1]MCY3055757.1 phosphomevalonate kinase [Aerococcus sp. Group 1]MCY3057488.1 phosphomevalonate kinase [Aerococcus sp. Group 1]
MQTIVSKRPGKLYVAGEYAIVHSFQGALLVAVDAYVTVELNPLDQAESRLSTNQAQETYTWHVDEAGEISGIPSQFLLVKTLIQTTYQYLRQSGQAEAPFQAIDIKITSDLDSPEGKKYGLGSSAAVSIAILEAILKLYQVNQGHSQKAFAYLLYQLGAIAQIKMDLKGSFGDLAAAAFGGCIYYQNFDHTWLRETLKHERLTLVDLSQMHWDGLLIEPLTLAKDWKLHVAWTETPSSTEAMLANGSSKKTADQDYSLSERHFRYASQQCVILIRQAIIDQDWFVFNKALTYNSNLLYNYTKHRQKPYLTPALKTAVDLAREAGASAKVSGAGGGDCALAFSPDLRTSQRIEKAWRQAGIHQLDLAPCPSFIQ